MACRSPVVVRMSSAPGQKGRNNAPLPLDSAYERMKQLRIDYILAEGDRQRRFAINRELVALAFEMKKAGASRAHIMTMGQASLYHAQREVAAWQSRGRVA